MQENKKIKKISKNIIFDKKIVEIYILRETR